jgi:hypothetical protein
MFQKCFRSIIEKNLPGHSAISDVAGGKAEGKPKPSGFGMNWKVALRIGSRKVLETVFLRKPKNQAD